MRDTTMKSWHLIHSEVQGKGHVGRGIPCQDKTAALSANGCQTVALADGAGSAEHSQWGADCVSRFICRYLCEHFERLYGSDDGAAVKQEILAELQTRLQQLAEDQGVDIKALASTLLAAAVKSGRYILLHLGDGLIAYRKGGDVLAATRPRNGEFANTTVFTTSPGACAEMRLIKGELGAIDGFALMSDGSAESLYSKVLKRPSAVLGKMMDYCTYYPHAVMQEEVHEALETTVKARTTDDCSLALLAAPLPDFKGWLFLPAPLRCRLLGLSYYAPHARRRMRNAAAVVQALQEPLAEYQLAQRVRIRRKYLYKPLQLLLRARLIEKRPDGRYAAL